MKTLILALTFIATTIAAIGFVLYRNQETVDLCKGRLKALYDDIKAKRASQQAN